MKFRIDINLQDGEYATQLAEMLAEVSESSIAEILMDEAAAIVEVPQQSIPGLMVWSKFSNQMADVNDFIAERSVL